ncbi:hypothetical protein SODALDRAFT_330526 [Sodiomyces alkalinus F11]|uniref:Protein-S-isoprenylcysteine O-methyltransferase n=1 Tax=Sodiomyces alkalinus (strain CBS 110278 / VKM F-3762 / F11) TaxID=1314773 RepID=A0A3N2Q2F0_SODAK|nr:hypothetical protein SODALDRAFT_330526 [Sodiomyces alkalinus F11]ROT40795.1 hypothetical protein SODALDRAFT_330526 [Sodiomyces alkalinus F11]
MSLQQVSLSAAIAASTIGTCIALSPPNAEDNMNNADHPPDLMHWLRITHKFTIRAILAPFTLLSLHTSALAYHHPNIPLHLLRRAAENHNLNESLLTWSPRTAIPLALILCAGIPLRLVPYSTLGTNFTFTLTKPDRLTTSGIYRYVQHPSYTGLAILVLSNAALLLRPDGALSSWLPGGWCLAIREWQWGLVSVALALMAGGISARVKQEERLLKSAFGGEWERWHAKTARFIPWVLSV